LTRKYWITEGNNVWAGALFANETTPFYHNARSDTGSFEFDYIPDGGEPIDFYAAAVTQTFYIANMLHDLFYLMGFTPAAGNYQIDTNGEGKFYASGRIESLE
jgi:extracellular elastinolytic metalloproteinase